MSDIPNTRIEQLRVTAASHTLYARALGFSPEFQELAGKKVLDVAAGRSDTAQVINTKGIGAQVHRVDPWYANSTPEYSAYMRSDDAAVLSYKDGEFDEVWNMNMLYSQTPAKRTAIIKEMLRVTKEGGYVRIFPVQPNEIRMRVTDIYGSGKGRKAWLYKPEHTTENFQAIIIHKRELNEELLLDLLGTKVKFDVPIF